MKKCNKTRFRFLFTLMLVMSMVFVISPKMVYAKTTSDLVFEQNYTFDGTGGLKEYDFTLATSGRITINFVANSTDAYSYVHLLTENNASELGTYESGGSYKKSFDLKAGSYVLIFNGHWYSTSERDAGKGLMNVTFTSADETYAESVTSANDEYGVASSVDSIKNATIKGQFAENDSVDYYTFTTTNAQLVTFSFASSLTSVNLHLFNDLLDFNYTANEMAAGSHRNTVALPAGTYYISFENKNTNTTGNYQFKISTSDLTKTTLSSMTSSQKKTLNVSVNKKAAITGYQVQIATNSSFTQGMKKYGITSNSKTIKGLTSGKTYYARVRTYTIANNGVKCYSTWSPVKKVKVK